MPLRVLHMHDYNFSDEDIRVVGNELDGGTSISGISDVIRTDGGGYWQADFSGADFGGPADDDREAVLKWRSANAYLSGGQSAVVLFCDRHHQPINDFDRGPWDPPSMVPASSGAEAHVLAVVNGQTGGLNCTILDISIVSERKLIGGERFTYVHATWGERCCEIISVQDISGGKRITFQPPIRGGIDVGDELDFDNPRCVMRRQSQPTNALNMGLWGSASITFVEDMRDPDA